MNSILLSIFNAILIHALLAITLNSPVIAQSDTLNILFHFHGTTDSSLIGSRVKGLGDINNDGIDDIALNSQSPLGTYIFYGDYLPDSIPDYFIRGSIDRGNPLDFTGDGITDILTLIPSENKIFLYKGFIDSLESIASDSIAPDSAVYLFGSSMTAGLISDDSVADLLVGDYNNPGGGKLYYYQDPFTLDKVSDWSFEVLNNSHTIRSTTLIDFNGDGYDDAVIALHRHLDTSSIVNIFLGPSFADSPDMILNAPNDLDSLSKENFGDEVTNIGDVNGDNWDDLGIIFNLKTLVFLCGPSADTIYDYVLSGGTNTISSAGDIDGNGFNDILGGEGRTFDGVVDLYLGGNIFDIYYDKSIYRSDLPPLFLDRIGWAVSSAGDFNNDGYDDILFSCQNFFGGDPGDVFVVAGGPDFITDVNEFEDENLPKNYGLFQNYPNPFNPSTTIEFNLPIRSQVVLRILNSLGQEVVTLLDRQLSAGTYKITWDGRDEAGKEVASGVYFYKLEAGDFVESKKMMLVR